MAVSLKDKNTELVSKRWAKALMDLAQEDTAVSKQDILNDLKKAVAVIESSEELSNAISNPSISTDEMQIVLCKLFQNSVLPIIYNFIFALNLKKRLNIISEISEEFEKECDRINNIIHVKVTSAIELDENKKEEIKNKISSKLNKKIVAEWETDNSIIAGLVFNIDETVVDNSVKHKLETLSNQIIKA